MRPTGKHLDKRQNSMNCIKENDITVNSAAGLEREREREREKKKRLCPVYKNGLNWFLSACHLRQSAVQLIDVTVISNNH